jgi:hypothetical protein
MPGKKVSTLECNVPPIPLLLSPEGCVELGSEKGGLSLVDEMGYESRQSNYPDRADFYP